MLGVEHPIPLYMERIILIIQLATWFRDRLCLGIDLHKDSLTLA